MQNHKYGPLFQKDYVQFIFAVRNYQYSPES